MLFWSGFHQKNYGLRKAKRKERHFYPAAGESDEGEKRAFSDMSASMTLEAACVLPWFLFAMLAVMQFFKVITVSAAVLAGMQDTAKDMAAYAYIRQLGISAGEGAAANLAVGGLSAVYAKENIQGRAKFRETDGTLHLWRSSFLEDEIIDLAVTYNAKNTYTLLPVPKVKSALRARVRAWTGRDGNGAASGGNESGKEETVLITETGTVYHTDENCTYLKRSIRRVDRQAVAGMRNRFGAKYHACERCGGGGSAVYITNDGNRYHSSLSCSALKRTVKRVPASEVKNKRACSKCGRL